ncbi:MAG: cysteine desulfurase [Acidobacteria bacterium]|nr:cysteine desulfurase [Acidobacteriota bacterium]
MKGLSQAAGTDRHVPVSGFDVHTIRRDFPALQQLVHGKPLVYLDNAATTQKPQSVIDALVRFYTADCANIHRGVHELSERATRAYEGTRSRIRKFLGAAEDREIIFVRGATEGINLVAQSFGRSKVRLGDEVVISALEHHSNIVPWQILCQETGARLRVAPIDRRGEIIMEEYFGLLGPRTRLVALSHVSNALGTVNTVGPMIQAAHAHGAVALIDGAQAVPHMRVDVRALDCDFYVLSGHKMYGPTGVGILYGKARLLEEMPPYQGGGDMISSVTFEKTLYNRIPYKFEAGTPNIAAGIALGAAADYLERTGMEAIAAHENDLLRHATESLAAVKGLQILGTAGEKAGVLSFTLDGIHPHDVGTILDREGIAIRTGHHCAQPVMDFYGVPATARASLSFYNTREEIDALVRGLHKVVEVFH